MGKMHQKLADFSLSFLNNITFLQNIYNLPKLKVSKFQF